MNISCSDIPEEGYRLSFQKEDSNWEGLKELDILPDAHLIIRDKILITDDEIIKVGDEIHLIQVISGG